MTGLSVLLLGLGLGIRHALDADHVVVVTTLLTREHRLRRTIRVAALWGAGHTISFLSLGLVVVLVGLSVPPELDRIAEVMVAGMLAGVGGWHAWRSLRVPLNIQSDAPLVLVRPLAIGVVHGLAGSAGVALLAASSVPSPTLAAVYLALVALGTVLGMVGLTVLLWQPLAWTLRRRERAQRVVALGAGVLGITLGAWILLAPYLTSQVD